PPLVGIGPGRDLEIKPRRVGRMDVAPHGKADAEVVADVRGLAVGVRHEREHGAEVPADSVLGARKRSGQTRQHHCRSEMPGGGQRRRSDARCHALLLACRLVWRRQSAFGKGDADRDWSADTSQNGLRCIGSHRLEGSDCEKRYTVRRILIRGCRANYCQSTGDSMSRTMLRAATYDDAKLLMELYEMRREPRLREARRWFTASFKVKTYDELMALCPPGSEPNASYRMVTSYWEMVASFITSGILHDKLFFQSGRELLLCWERVRDVVPHVREQLKNPL